MNKYYIYGLLRPDYPDPFYVWQDQPFYFGKGKCKRIYYHRREAKKKIIEPGKKSIKINIIHKLWEQNLDFKEVILFDNLTEQEAFEIENKLIKKYGRINNNTGCLANLTDGGEGPSGMVHTKKTRIRMKEAQLGEKNHFYGKHHTKESLNKMSENGMKGKHHTEETKKLISEKISGENNGFYGKHHTEETRNKLSESKTGKQIGEDNPNYGHYWTDEMKQRARELKLGKIKINKEGKTKVIDRKNLEQYLNSGWELGTHQKHNNKTKLKIKNSQSGRK